MPSFWVFRLVNVALNYITSRRCNGLVLLALLLCACAPTQPTATPILVPTPQLTPTTVIAQPSAAPRASATATTAVATSVPPTPVAPERLVERSANGPIEHFGPPAPSGRWLIGEHADATFGVYDVVGPRPSLPTLIAGQPLAWSNDGALVLYTPALSPTLLAALEPSTALTATVLTSQRGAITGLAWLKTQIIYAAQADDRLQLVELTGQQERVVGQLMQQQLLPGGMQADRNLQWVALLTEDVVSGTLQLSIFTPTTGDLQRIDSGPGGPVAGVQWSDTGQLAYDLGAGLRLYDPATGLITQSGIDAQPLAWPSAGLLARQPDDTLVRWRNDGRLQSFDTGSGQVQVRDAQSAGLGKLLFLINGEVWRSTLP